MRKIVTLVALLMTGCATSFRVSAKVDTVMLPGLLIRGAQVEATVSR